MMDETVIRLGWLNPLTAVSGVCLVVLDGTKDCPAPTQVLELPVSTMSSSENRRIVSPGIEVVAHLHNWRGASDWRKREGEEKQQDGGEIARHVLHSARQERDTGGYLGHFD